jgi:hypothetical protein
MSVCLSARNNWTNVKKILYLKISQKSVEKIQVSLKSDNNNGTVRAADRPIYMFYVSYLAVLPNTVIIDPVTVLWLVI